MNEIIEIFKEQFPSRESYWRSIVLFGKTTSSYKFALGKSLIQLVLNKKTSINLDELAIPYYENICSHLLHCEKQTTNNTSIFIENCKKFNNKEISQNKLIASTIKNGFRYILDTFHVVNNKILDINFFEYDKINKKIVLTDDIYSIFEYNKYLVFNKEIEARWKLVETAWSLKIPLKILSINYDKNNELLFLNNNRRINITSSRDALNGYQKGKCFYCFSDISIDNNSNNLCDVDHFFPLTLQKIYRYINFNGIWNLVLCCKKCNRGINGKSAHVPDIKYLNRLYKRNEFLINSHHPLSETIIRQTGNTTVDRIKFLKKIDSIAISNIMHRWETNIIGVEEF